ncbi:MAG: UPF0280 family protein [Rhodobacteraceae bacterium]|nr:UPF0280 family protein [Paracoccaceae bacterium]
MVGPVAALLGDGSRLHLQHGPIDLVIGVDAAAPTGRKRGFEAATRRFGLVLGELVGELPLLRSAIVPGSAPPVGDIARRMEQAVRPYLSQFVTPMAAVAGAVADEVLAAIVADTDILITRAYVNNGGDIALHLGPGTEYVAAIAGLDGTDHGRILIDANIPVRGIATSGLGGRSLSFGIADSVSVLGHSAAAADVAATLIANAVDLPGHASITRLAATEIDPDSDLGDRQVVVNVRALNVAEIDAALSAGAAVAQTMYQQGRILGAALSLQGSQCIVGALPKETVTQTKPQNTAKQTRMVNHA